MYLQRVLNRFLEQHDLKHHRHSQKGQNTKKNTAIYMVFAYLKLCITCMHCVFPWDDLLIKYITHSNHAPKYPEPPFASLLTSQFLLCLWLVMTANCSALVYIKCFTFHFQLWRWTPCYIVHSTCMFLKDRGKTASVPHSQNLFGSRTWKTPSHSGQIKDGCHRQSFMIYFLIIHFS